LAGLSRRGLLGEALPIRLGRGAQQAEEAAPHRFLRAEAAARRQLAGRQAAEAIQLYLEYAPEPPFDAGTPETAPATLVAATRARSTASREAREAIISAVTRRSATAAG
jgi:hypothetical protein